MTPSEFPASFDQQRLWLQHELNPDASLYNVARLFRISGPLRVDALRNALQAVVKRHEILRTTFGLNNGEVVQLVWGERAVEISIVDLSGGPVADRDERVRNIAAQEAQHTLDLSAGPLMRTTLVKLHDDDHALVVVMHHIITDGWSMNIFFREIAEFYQCFVSDRPPVVPELPIQYARFAQWQWDTLTANVLRPHLNYWRERLRGAAPFLPLPYDYSRSSTNTGRGRNEYLEIEKRTAEGLKHLSRQSGASLFMTLLAAFQVLLCRYTSTEDVVIGTPVAGRNDVDLENLIGFFVNTLVIRSDLCGNPSFRDLLSRTREVALEAFEHQDTPFEKIVEELQPVRDLNSTPLFQVMFMLNSSPSRLQIEGLRSEEVAFEAGRAKFPITLEVIDANGLFCTLEYSTDLFKQTTIQRMLSHFQRLLNSIVENADYPIADLAMLSDSEQRTLLSEWNDTAAPYTPLTTIHSVIESAAERTPDALAFLCEERQLTFHELNRKANQVAWYLIGRGLKPETPVGVLLERSLDVPVAMLAVLKAGAAFVPLDPTYPTQRLSYMLERSGAPFVITHRGLKTRLPRHNVELVPLDDDERVLQGQRQDNPSVSVPADTIAYIIYTSGSTGQPKGVCGTHRASLNRFLWMSRTYPFARDEVTCQKTSLSFVDSIWEIFGPALNGVSVVIVPDETVTNLERFIRILAHHGITRIVLVPSYLRLLLDHCEDLQSIVPKLTWCVTSGEVLPPDLARRFHQKLPRVRLLNLYGSSEVAGDVTYFEVTESDGTSSIPIGRPIANTQIYLLDCHQKPVPVGASGEIHVAGDSLGRGYWRDPELTAERFVPNPFSVEADARLFKTGDLGRYRTDGVIEYLGRADAQIKIRGVRIEPGEIESALKSHPLVRDAVVIASGHLGEDARLIAYVIRQDHRTPPSIELRHHVRTVLPEYMVPSAIFVIDSLPLLPNGKVDRLCMLRSGQPETASEAVLVEPRNSTEESLVQIWREVLSVSRVSIDDNFFELGGHSLLGIRVFSRIRKVFQVELPLKALFNQPTISGLALEIEKAHRNGMVLREPLVSNVSSRPNKAQLLAKLDKLSAEEIDDLLNKVIGGKGN